MTKFQEFWKTLSTADQESLASKAETTTDYLRIIASGHRNAGRATVKKLMAANKEIKLEMFFN